MGLELVEIPGFEPRHETIWKVRALVVNGRDPVRAALARWSQGDQKDYKAIMKVMRLAAQQEHIHNPKHVKKSANPKHSNVYEMLAYTEKARLMFFYDDTERALIICTNEYEKGVGDQDAAFRLCSELRKLYFQETKDETRKASPHR